MQIKKFLIRESAENNGTVFLEQVFLSQEWNSKLHSSSAFWVTFSFLTKFSTNTHWQWILKSAWKICKSNDENQTFLYKRVKFSLRWKLRGHLGCWVTFPFRTTSKTAGKWKLKNCWKIAKSIAENKAFLRDRVTFFLLSGAIGHLVTILVFEPSSLLEQTQKLLDNYWNHRS